MIHNCIYGYTTSIDTHWADETIDAALVRKDPEIFNAANVDFQTRLSTALGSF